MSATQAQLGARALRKLGFGIVADASRPQSGPTQTAQQIAGTVLRELGIPVPESDRPDLLGTVGVPEIAARTLRAVGVNPIAQSAAPAIADPIVPLSQVASRGLLLIGINPVGSVTGQLTGPQYGASEIGTKALLKLGVMDPAEGATEADQTLANAKVLAVHDGLTKQGIASWSSNAIPAWAVEWYVLMVASLLASEFGKAGDPKTFEAGEAAIREGVLSGLDSQTRAEQEILAVHGRLAAQNLVAWDVNAIPARAADSYAMLVAAFLGPVYGKTFDPGNAEVRLRQIALAGPNGQAIAEAKVRAVHDAMNVAGVVAWPITAIPEAHAEDYVTMAAALMGPVLGHMQDAASRQVDTAAWDAAEGRVRKAATIRGAQDRALARVQAVQDELNASGLVTWDADAIPQAAADAYASMATAMMGAETGKPMDPAQYAANAARIRRIVMGGPAGQALAEQKIAAVHASLDARGLTRWTLYDLPDYAEEPYVCMAAALLAPEVDAKADPSWGPGGEAAIRRLIMIQTQRMPLRVDYF